MKFGKTTPNSYNNFSIRIYTLFLYLSRNSIFRNGYLFQITKKNLRSLQFPFQPFSPTKKGQFLPLRNSTTALYSYKPPDHSIGLITTEPAIYIDKLGRI